MSIKIKLISLILLFLLVLPVFLPPTRQGRVLGITDDKTSQVNSEEDNSGQIGGGVIDNKLTNAKSSSASEIKGYAVLDKEAITSVSSNKFPLASEIKVTSKNKTFDLIISNKAESFEKEVVLVVDQKTFALLGGDVEIQDKIEVSVSEAN